MRLGQWLSIALAGLGAGAVSGMFGAGGGMILVPLLGLMDSLRDEEIFPSSVCIMLPICITSLLFIASGDPLPLKNALPYLIGSMVGGILSGLFGKKIPTKLLHRVFGCLILWGGIRYLC